MFGKTDRVGKFGPMTGIARSLLFALVGALGLAGTLSPLAAQSSISVVVNGDIITSYDIAQRARLLPLLGNKGGTKAATEELIDETIKLQEARKRGLRIPDRRIDGAFAAMGKEKKLSPKQLAAELGRIGITAETMKRWIKAQMTWRELVQARVRREGQVKTADIMSAMLEKKGTVETTVTEFRLQQIIFIVPDGSSNKYIAQRRREAEGFRIRFPGCEASLAQAKGLKGVVVKDMGRRDSSQLRGQQGEEVQNTELGKTTRPFQTGNGIELIAVCSKRDFQSDAAARAEVETQLRLEQANDLGKDYLKELRDVAIIQRR